jgi:hypothetical protein
VTPEIRREIQDLKDGRLSVTGTFTLAVDPATSTLVTRRVVSSSSVVLPVPYDAAAAAEGIPRIVPAKGQFVVHHGASTSTRTYRYTVFTGNT